MLAALLDRRALAASVLASEAGVARPTASEHLSRLTAGGLLSVEQHGRHRYYRLADPQIAELLETVARFAPMAAVRSLQDDTKATTLRRARTCYNHLAGRLGVGVGQSLLDCGAVVGHDGSYRPGLERLSAVSGEVVYRLTDTGIDLLSGLGIDPKVLQKHRHALRHCVDSSEQRHHLAGPVGSALAERMRAMKWIQPDGDLRSRFPCDCCHTVLAIVSTWGTVAVRDVRRYRLRMPALGRSPERKARDHLAHPRRTSSL
jgi:DNA-binding transcriptional ArsR family regulator